MNMIVTGTTGSGKTYFVLNILAKADKEIYAFSEHIEDFQTLEKLSEKSFKYYEVITPEMPVNLPGNTCIDLSALTDSERLDWLDRFFAFKATDYNSIYYIDEAHAFFPSRTIGKHSVNLERVIRGGRKRGQDVIMITHRPQDLDLSILSQAMYIVSFRSPEKNTAERIAVNIGVTPEEIMNLPEYTAISYNTKTGERERIKI